MEVDPPHISTSGSSSPVSNGGSSTLKRSNSAPMINSLVATSEPEASPSTDFKPATSVAIRRLSSSNMALHNASAPASPPIRGTDRVARIKQEEIHIADRERQHEKEIQSSLWISNNWDHLSFDPSEAMEGQHRRPRSFSESLHILTQSNILSCGSPSPTRGPVKQCFSPSMQIPVKSNTFTPSPSPSPTRKNFMRSLSPIAIRTGPLKRKLDDGGGDRHDYISPPKKFNTGPATPDRIMTCSHPLANSPDPMSVPTSSTMMQTRRQHHCSAPGLVQHHYHGGGSASPLCRSPHSSLTTGDGVGIYGNSTFGGGSSTSSGLGSSAGHSPLSSISPSSSTGGIDGSNGGQSPQVPHRALLLTGASGGIDGSSGGQSPQVPHRALLLTGASGGIDGSSGGQSPQVPHRALLLTGASGGIGRLGAIPSHTQVQGGLLAPVMLSTKQPYLFQPVSEGLGSPLSSSSSSPSSSVSMSLQNNVQPKPHPSCPNPSTSRPQDEHGPHSPHQHPLQKLKEQPLVHLHEKKHHHPEQHQQHSSIIEQHPAHPLHHHHHLYHTEQQIEMHSDDAASRGSASDVYMTDTEMGEHSLTLEKPSSCRGFNFKPINPEDT